MDHVLLKENEYAVDLESGLLTDDEVGVPISVFPNSKEVSSENRKVLNEENLEKEKCVYFSEKKPGKENRKSTSAKKPPKPPRPPRGFSLDAADQKLIKEIAQLAMIKRARIERMKAMKKLKAAKASSSSGSLLAMVFTVIFFVVILFQGMSFSSTAINLEGTPDMGRETVGSFLAVQNQLTPSSSVTISSASLPSNQVEQVLSYDPSNNARKAVG